MVCAETLYKEYYRRQKAGEKLPPLPRAHRKRRRRGKRYTNAGAVRKSERKQTPAGRGRKMAARGNLNLRRRGLTGTMTLKRTFRIHFKPN